MAINSHADTDTNRLQHITWKQIYRKPNTLRLPFHLILADSQGSIFCEKMLRLLRGKRIVFKGRWQNQPVVVKLFIEPGRAATHFSRELAGIQALTESGTPTPRLLYHGYTQRYRIPVLVTEYLTQATDLATLWESSPDKETLLPLMQAVTLELATQHVQGILQHDLHFGNLLVKPPQIFSLDGDSIEFFSHPLPRKQTLDHLALFFAQLGTGSKSLQEHLLTVYAESRGWRLKPSDLRYLAKMTHHASQRRLLRYRKKVLRGSTHTRFLKRLGTRIWYNPDYESPALLQLLRDPDAVFRRKETTLLKNGHSSTVARIAVGEDTFVIKRYNMKHFLHWLRRCLRPTRAVHCWQQAHCLQLAGVATARPVACIEKHFLGMRRQSYYLMEQVEGITLAEYFAHYDPGDPRFGRVAKRVARLLSQLQEMRLSHGDMKASNFLVELEKPVLIDLDGMKKHSSLRKDYQRFMANWANHPEVAALFQNLLNVPPSPQKSEIAQ